MLEGVGGREERRQICFRMRKSRAFFKAEGEEAGWGGFVVDSREREKRYGDAPGDERGGEDWK